MNAPFAGQVHNLRAPYLLFLGSTREIGYAKTALGLRDWAPDKCIGEMTLDEEGVTTGLDRLSPTEAAARGAGSMVVGVANAGGRIEPDWIPSLIEALDAGLDLVSGLHARLADIPLLKAAAERSGSRLIDVRSPPPGLGVASGAKRSGMRLLTVGTDCALGKKYSALAIARAMEARGVDADFRASGQTGILISGAGIAIDAVIADFAAGAAELLSPPAAPDHWDVIEGQGSLFHPAYAGVSLALLHGSQPDAIIVCHQAGRGHILGYPDYPIPPLEEVIARNIELGRRTNPAIRCAGVSINTSALGEAEVADHLERESDRLGLPVADPMRGGQPFEALLDQILAA